jgi:hypothetical protein
MDGRRTRRRVATVGGAVVGTIAGSALALLTDVGTAQRDIAPPEPWIEATHLPPLLTAPGEAVELRYDAYCASAENVDEPCEVEAAVSVRRGSSGTFHALPVTEERGAPEGRLVAAVPDSIARFHEGFSYYAVLRDVRTRATTTLPAGGAEAPQISRPLVRPTEIPLGKHAFGAVRRANARVVSARWGSGQGEIGLEPGRQLAPIGGSSFDIGPDGSVHVLDQANRRVVRWPRAGGAPDEELLAINGTLADLAAGSDGTTYVLETTSSPGETAVVRAFDAGGRSLGTTSLVERGSQLQADDGVVRALEHPSGQWMEVFASGRPVAASRQERTGRPGRRARGGEELVVLRTGDELRVALAGGHGVKRSWRIVSETPLAEVQLAEIAGRGVVVVLRVYSDSGSEFRVFVLGERGLVESFSVPASDWAETAPLARFRLHGQSLYQLGSTPEGLFVDRYHLEVER